MRMTQKRTRPVRSLYPESSLFDVFHSILLYFNTLAERDTRLSRGYLSARPSSLIGGDGASGPSIDVCVQEGLIYRKRGVSPTL